MVSIRQVINTNQLTVRLAQLLCCLCTLLLSSCVSTEELYAEYDASNCKVIIEKQVDKARNIREKHSDPLQDWLPVVFFDHDDDTLTSGTIERLQVAVQVLDKTPRANIVLQGFADHLGSISYNLDLAYRRARNVQQWLVAKGIEKDRISLRPIGEGLPSFGLDSDKSRAHNRRVELLLLDDKGLPIVQTQNAEGE